MIYDYITLFILAFNIALGLFVFLKNKDKQVSIPFLLFTVFIFGWGASLFMVKSTGSMFWAWLTFSCASLLPFILLWFLVAFPKRTLLYKYLMFLAMPAIFFAVMSWVPGFLFSGIEVIDGVIVTQRNFPLKIFSIYFVIYIVTALYILIKNYFRTKGLERAQVLFLLIGISIFALLSILSNVVMPNFFNIQDFNTLGPAFSVVFVAFTTYSILAHHLFDIRVIIRRTVVYSVLLAFVLAVYSLVIFVFTQAFGTGGQAITAKTIVPNLLAAVFIAAGFEPLRKWLTKCTDKFLFKGEYKPQDVLNKLSGVLSSVLDLDEALTSIIGILVTEMRLTRAGAFVLTHDPESKKMIVKRAKTVGYGEEKITLKPDGYLITYYEQYIKSHKEVTCKDAKDEKKRAVKKCNVRIDSKPIITEELEREAEMNSAGDEIVKNTITELKNLQAQVSLPIIVKGKLIGIFILGAKKSGDIFSDSDLELLTSVANQTAAAIEKARFYEEDQLKSEFVSIASHELLTPTSAIEGYLSMILDEGMGKVDPQAKKYLDNVYASSKRLAGLVKDLLNVSRIEGGRIIVQSKNFDLKEMIKQVVAEMQPKANEKNLQFAAEGLDREVPQVWADPERVHQVLINLIGNAIKYTDKGSVRVRLDFSLSVVRVSVIDTGVGIPKDEIPHLFEKFYRASNADNSGAQGTGLGLYITKQIVELMGGMIQVDSEKGKGSVFSFSLPRAKENEKAIQNK